MSKGKGNGDGDGNVSLPVRPGAVALAHDVDS